MKILKLTFKTIFKFYEKMEKLKGISYAFYTSNMFLSLQIHTW